MSHVFAKPIREIEEVVHHQNLRLGWIEESLEEVGQYFSLLLVFVPEFVGSFVSPGVDVAQGVDQDHVLEVDVNTETLIEISTSLTQFSRQVFFTGLDPQGEVVDFRDPDLDELVVFENPPPDFARPHSDLRSANTAWLNATRVPNHETRDPDSGLAVVGRSGAESLSE
jgi:hypothetical protein